MQGDSQLGKEAVSRTKIIIIFLTRYQSSAMPWPAPTVGWQPRDILQIEAVLMITVFGALHGLLALWRKSLRPGMITHAWSDIFGVVLFKGI